MGPGVVLLLDTHVWWWALSEPALLSEAAQQSIEEGSRELLAVSAISLWELSLLFSRGKIALSWTPDEWFAMAQEKVRVIPLTSEVALEAYRLPGDFQRDPADRLIVATTRSLGATLITKDQAIRDYPYVKTLW